MSRMKTMGWEYMTRVMEPNELLMEAELDAIGIAAWELCSIVTTDVSRIYYFKRPKDVTDYDSRD